MRVHPGRLRMPGVRRRFRFATGPARDGEALLGWKRPSFATNNAATARVADGSQPREPALWRAPDAARDVGVSARCVSCDAQNSPRPWRIVSLRTVIMQMQHQSLGLLTILDAAFQ